MSASAPAPGSATLPARKGRGAVTNASGRYEAYTREAADDGWGSLEEEAETALRTTVQPDTARRVIARNDSPDVPFDRSINPYRGCEHGCVYCFARPTHAYLGLSPGLDFETRLFAKHDAAARLEEELARPGYRCRPIALGANTDPYQPVERRLAITRSILEVLEAYGHPVTVVTKGALVTRDVDILARMAERRLASVALSVTTLDGALARSLEPRASAPAKRLAAIETLASAGIPTGILSAPLIPGLNDWEMERVLEAGAKAGAGMANYTLLRLPLEIKDLMAECLQTHAPDRAGRVLSLVKQCHGGRLYDADFAHRLRGQGPYADQVRQRFKIACRKFGLDRHRAVEATDDGPHPATLWGLDCTQFAPPPRKGDQLSLL